ncbi:rod shape determining protein RodA [Parabacteroides sp. PF5-5]|uniref:rod shape-determining protein RodA n=1 Tax=unclassified Parabacteroides TaxID=2649774 RepID=UPI002476B5C3|nr:MULTISPECIES: rod shape-determining protein RodA [unclassified Parabacteroides]MDH6305476.1 rod shape determining protein RodA [Parabacteroides sp. PH5-39]MDH6316186.1 rod shape determining protein RodA [Parabacteroides sp. PF5-13]MDH6320336.1 rod shape determining protein RodA [Parabacteroides sp. PH5-13]MDH6324066.1 rod shape determining protein RodA [Parabacteroides sp. PH5-8]MDH6327377.1 rod shape determining protein RodA [Parabacteroides sp. PH5-41]
MPYKKISIWRSIDWITILLYVIMIVAGWFSICGASYEYDNVGLFDPSGRPGSQLIWIGLSFVLIFIILMLDADFYSVFSYLIYGMIILLLIATVFLAPEIKGSRSWLVIGPLRLQPAEFAKFATALALAKCMSSYGFKLVSFKNFMLCMLIIFLPMVCILLQKETGSALVYLAFFLVLYREGMSGYVLLAGICAVTFFVLNMKFTGILVGATPMGELIVLVIIQLILTGLTFLVQHKNNTLPAKIIVVATAAVYLVAYLVLLLFSIPINFVHISLGIIAASCCFLIFLAIKNWVWHYLLIILFALLSVGFLFSVDYVFNEVLEPHQQVRIKVSLGLEDDPSGAGYNVNQSKIAIGSGGLLGKGFLNGTQTKLKYVPEQDTDFIFCTVGEEQGFIGSSLTLIVFAIFIIRLIILSEKQKTAFNRIYGYSVASIFFFHLVINIGMVIGLTPVIGIPLPFFSYGGSALWGFTILLFIFLRLDATRKER